MARSMLEARIARKLAGETAPAQGLAAGGVAGGVVGGLAARPRRVRCYHCGESFEVSPHARTGPCARCYKRLCFDDLVVQPTTAPLPAGTALITCGMVVVEPQARAELASIEAMDGVEVGGRLHATIRARGPVVVGSAGELTGEVRAPSVEIRAGAVASVYFRTGKFAQDETRTLAE